MITFCNVLVQSLSDMKLQRVMWEFNACCAQVLWMDFMVKSLQSVWKLVTPIKYLCMLIDCANVNEIKVVNFVFHIVMLFNGKTNQLNIGTKVQTDTGFIYNKPSVHGWSIGESVSTKVWGKRQNIMKQTGFTKIKHEGKLLHNYSPGCRWSDTDKVGE